MRLVFQFSRELLLTVAVFAGVAPPTWGAAATIAPPMLDISKQCEVASGRNATAMSECVVAESIARSDLLRKWDTLTDANVQICLQANRKAKRRPYSTLAKCLSTAEPDLKVAPAVAHAIRP